MAFLKVFGKILEYKDSAEAARIIREHAINFITTWKIKNEKKIELNEKEITILDFDKKSKEKSVTDNNEKKSEVSDEYSSIKLDFKTENKKEKELIKEIKKEIEVEVPTTKFGYEFEVIKVVFDDKERTVKLDLSGEIDIFQKAKLNDDFVYQPEYAKWMIEVVPSKPFTLNQLPEIESSILNLQENFDKNIGNGNYLFLSVFPHLGVGEDYFQLPDIENKNYYPTEDHVKAELEHREHRKNNKISESSYIHDIITTNHPRFETLSAYTRKRTGKKQDIFIPIYEDKFTLKDCKDEKYPGFIHNDAFAAGMGNGCLQLTAGMNTLNSGLYVYDQLIPIMPVIMALSASSPFFKGKLSKHDNRFLIINQGCDERTEEEKDPQNEKYIFSSRYSSIYSYISENQYVRDHHNNQPKMPINKEFHEKLIKKGFPPRFATHLCNLLVRDPMVIFEEKIHIDDPLDNTHFLNFLSTNWNSLRFKPPSPSSEGDELYKVEIRPCDLQISEFENAAIITFVMLYIELIKNNDVNFIIPLNLVEENFNNSVLMDAVSKGKFYWRTNSIIEPVKNSNCHKMSFNSLNEDDNINLIKNNSSIKNNFDYKNSNWMKTDFLINENGLPENYLDESLDLKKNIKLLSLNEILEGSNCISTYINNSQFNQIIKNICTPFICNQCKMNMNLSDCSTSIVSSNKGEDDFEDCFNKNDFNYFNNGNTPTHYKGLIPLMIDFAKKKYENDQKGLKTILNHLELIRLRAQGKLMSNAQYYRKFILNHPEYKQNSIISKEINYDLMKHIVDIQNKKVLPEELYGKILTENYETFEINSKTNNCKLFNSNISKKKIHN